MKVSDANIFDERLGPPNEKVYPKASIKELKSNTLRDLFADKIIHQDKLIAKDLPCIDYFICYQNTYEIEYDWILLDMYYLAYDSDFSKISVRGWLISKKLKEILEMTNLKFGSDHTFHPAKLRFQGSYLDFYLFQYLSPNREDILDKTRLVSKEDANDILDISLADVGRYVLEIKYKQLHQNKYIEYSHKNYYDLIFHPYHKGTLISEKFKSVLEENNIKGIEISDWDSIKLKFENNLPV